jgi:D-aspartate ligase
MQQRTSMFGAVVLGDGYNALGVVRSLGRQGIPAILIDNVPRLAWRSRYVRHRFPWYGSMESQDFVEFLLSLGQRESLQGWILWPCTDETVDLAARHRPALGAVYRLATPEWRVVRQATDKRLTYRLAQEVQVPYPRTWYPSNEEQLAELDVRYPAIVKPAMSSRFCDALGVKALPADTPDDLRAQYRHAAARVGGEELMIQEIISGAGTQQFSVAAYARDGRMVRAMTARRLRQYPIDFGLRSSYVQAVEVPEVLELGERLIAGMGASGMLEIEFKCDARDGEYKLLDINLRPWAWHALCPACGLDFPYIQYRDLLGLPLEPAAPKYGAHWVRALTDLPAGWQEIRAGRTTPHAYLRSLAGRTVFSAFDWRDPLPAAHDLGAHVTRALRRHSQRPVRPTTDDVAPVPDRHLAQAASSGPREAL